MIKKIRTSLWGLLLGFALLGLGACSVEKYQPEGEVLYTGIKTIEVAGSPSGRIAEEAVVAATAQLEYAPNGALMGSSSLRLPNPLFRPWLYLRYKDSSSWLGKVLHRVGKRPIWLSDVSPSLRAEVAKRILREYGYFSANVTSSVLPHAGDSLKAKVSYSIDLGKLYLLDSVEYLPRWYIREGHTLEHQYYSPLKRGTPFSLMGLEADRKAVSAYLREEGYHYFTPEYIRYDADTLQKSGYVSLRARLVDGLGSEVLRQWRIGDIKVRFVGSEETGTLLGADTLAISPGIQALYSGRMPIRPRVLLRRLHLRPDSLYRASLESLMQKSLMSIGAFSGLDIVYSPRSVDSLSDAREGLLDMQILLREDKPWHVNLGTRFLLKSTDFMGPGLTLGLTRYNIFGGGETLSLSASASYEWQMDRSASRQSPLSINSYHLNLEGSLSFPTLLIPGRLSRYYPYFTTTTLKLSSQRLNRAGFYALGSLSLALSYDWAPRTGQTHSFTPLSFSYSSLGSTTAEFDAILRQNPSLALSLADQLIPQVAYSYIWDQTVGKGKRHRLGLRFGVSEAGNLTKLLFSLSREGTSREQHIFGVPFAQFVKGYGELRYTHSISSRHSLALRASLGAIYSYDNMERAPYMEQFYVGGASSLRAFTVRSLGPGGFRPTTAETNYSFMDHVGEAKLEVNAEWRTKLFGNLEGAVFLDAGNIWLLRADALRPRAALRELSGLGDFVDQLAVGTGLGLRYDIGYFVLRADVGLGLHLPYETERRGWYNIPHFGDAFAVHIAIGYPF